MSIQQNLARCFKTLQKIENISISLVEDHIDKWEVNYTYPNNKEVTLRFDFHLKELLPPKITVVFPASIQYVCFQELGTNEWKNNNDLVTLIYALQTEFNYRAQTRQEGKVLTPEEAQSQWKFVQGAHTDWGYVDVVELSKKIETVELDNLRKEGSVALNEISEPPALPNSEQVAENKEPVVENKEPIVENKEPIVENKEPVAEIPEQPPVPENQELVVPPENQVPAAVIENKEPVVLPENQEPFVIEQKNEKNEELVKDKKEIEKNIEEEQVQENREDLLQENKEEIIIGLPQ